MDNNNIKLKNMKTYKYLFLLLASLSIIGCSDLEEEPIGLLVPEGFFQTTKDIQTAVNGTYGHMTHEAFWGRKLPLTIMLRSDMVDIGDPTTASRRIEHNDFEVLTDNGMISVYWPRVYQTISAANAAIAGANAVDVPDEEKNPVIAQAYFSRAFVYFHLVRQFGDIPYIDKPILDADIAGSISKTAVAEVYTNIIADLEFAKRWLPDTQVARSLPSKGAASSYLALVYLTMGEYQKASDEAKEVIGNEGTYGYALDVDYQNLFNANEIDGSPEPIFALDFNAFRDGNAGNDQLGPITGLRGDEQYDNGGGWSVAVPSLLAYSTWDDQDYRKAVSLDETGVNGGITLPYTEFHTFHSRAVDRPHIAKFTRYPGAYVNGNGRATSINYSMMRYAEILLIAAEALNEVSGGSAEAHGYVNRVRARARDGALGSVPSTVPADVSGLSQDEFRVMVLEERRLEFAFESKRWYDIVRRKIGSEVFGASGLEGFKPGFDPNQDYLLPLPADELVRNPNLMPNNPGY